MPALSAEKLFDITERLITAMGSPPDEALMMAEVLVESNLAGHDSHGVIRLAQYARYIKEGQIRPGAPFEIEKQTAAMAMVNGNMNLGHVIMLRALDVALQKAEQTAVATVMARNCNHIGRLGAYTLRAAQRGFGAMLAVNAPSRTARLVVPWGGTERRMSTNPLSFATPTRGEPLVLDITTSVVAEGKLRVLYHKKEPTPPGWIVDHEGKPMTDTAAFYGNPPGALLPLGGSVGYKGFGLGVMLDLLCGAMSGQGVLRPDLAGGQNGVWLTLWKIDAFVPLEQFYDETEKLSAWIKSSRRQPGVSEILLPGEIEARTTEQRKHEGISLPDETWSEIQAVATEFGVRL